MKDNLRTWIVSLLAGIVGAILLIGLYLAVLSIAKSPLEALNLFWQNKFMLLTIALGFGLQAGMYVLLRTGLHRPVAIPGGGTAPTAGGGMSSLAMLACCAPVLVHALPLLGITALTTLLAKWQMLFIVASLLANAIGITVMGRALWKTLRQYRTHPIGSTL